MTSTLIDNAVPETRYSLQSTEQETPVLSNSELRTFAPSLTPSVAENSRSSVSSTARRILAFATVGALQLGIQSTPLISGTSPRSRTNDLTITSTWWPSEIADSFELDRSLRPEPAVAVISTSPERAAAQRALIAADDLRRWLSLTAGEVAELGGFARRSLANWQNGRGAYGASSRYLLSVHALVEGLVRSLGESAALLWLQTPINNGRSALDLLRDGEPGLRTVLVRAEPLLFRAGTPASQVVSWDDLSETADDETVAYIGPASPEEFAARPVSRRRRPAAGLPN